MGPHWSQRLRRPVAIGLVIIASWLLLVAGNGIPPQDQIPAGRPPTQAELAAFTDLIQRHERIYYEARKTCDVAQFPMVFYNDPAIQIPEGYRPLVDRYQEVIPSLINQAAGPVGAEYGFLSGTIAGILNGCRSIEAWQEIVAKAEAAGLHPDPDDMPEGLTPMEPVMGAYNPSTFNLFGVRVDNTGDHAVVNLVWNPPGSGRYVPDSEDYQPYMWERFFLSKVDRDWYLSGAFHCEPTRYGDQGCQD